MAVGLHARPQLLCRLCELALVDHSGDRIGRDLLVGGVHVFRRYPNADMLRAVLGKVGTDGIGLAGLERQYQNLLAGTPGLALLSHIRAFVGTRPDEGELRTVLEEAVGC